MHRIDNIDCRNVAVSNVAATSRLNVISEDGGGSSLRTDGTHANPITSEIVETVVLDDLNLHDIGFIKIDVEGFEDKVISGGLKTLEASNFPMILFESNNSSDFNNVVSVLPKVYTVNGINGIPNMFIAHKI
jgi:FkbM family methyltransferase